ncbi:hypothetical protein [Bosea sp. R86505]|uniref:hypothetical protein n=1 Tax=Bosea sp. R86505 TaxID=3101710 RepID=UPI003672D4B3
MTHHTDWSKVNIEALRQHLADMSAVTLHSDAKVEPIDGGMMFIVTGAPPVRDAIRRMALAHAATMNNVGSWQLAAAEIEVRAIMAVKAPVADLAKLKGLGFIGVMTRGMHHQEHHLMIARCRSSPLSSCSRRLLTASRFSQTTRNIRNPKRLVSGGRRMSATVKGFGCRPMRAGSDWAEGRRPKASKGGSRGPGPWAMGISPRGMVCEIVRGARRRCDAPTERPRS